jgi:ribulose-phosphate 3-epimerase
VPPVAAQDLLRARLAGAHPPILSVGLMAADPGHLARDLDAVGRAGIEMVHVDVMDGRFCRPVTVGPAFLRSIPDSMIKDVHLLVDDPAGAVESFVEAGADMVTFHVEAAPQPRAVLRRIGEGPRTRERRDPVVRGIAVNPSTPLEFLEPLLDGLDYILLLAIDPGWPGQSFAGTTQRRLERVRRMVEDAGVSIAVGIDGGVTAGNLGAVASLAPDVVVSGSAIFDGRDAPANVRTFLHELARSEPVGNGAAATVAR